MKEIQVAEERSPTFSFAGTEGVLLAAFPTGSFFSCVRDFTEVSRDGKVSLGTGVAPRTADPIKAPVREKTNHVVLTLKVRSALLQGNWDRTVPKLGGGTASRTQCPGSAVAPELSLQLQVTHAGWAAGLDHQGKQKAFKAPETPHPPSQEGLTPHGRGGRAGRN